MESEDILVELNELTPQEEITKSAVFFFFKESAPKLTNLT